MNLALPALVVFVLLLPGFLARSRFKRIERSSLDFLHSDRSLPKPSCGLAGYI
jgi:hypothetical protein